MIESVSFGPISDQAGDLFFDALCGPVYRQSASYFDCESIVSDPSKKETIRFARIPINSNQIRKQHIVSLIVNQGKNKRVHICVCFHQSQCMVAMKSSISRPTQRR